MSDSAKPEAPGAARSQPAAPPAASWPGGVRRAGRSASGDETAAATGQAWSQLLDELRRAGEIVLAPGGPTSALDRAEGFHHLGVLLRNGLGEMQVEIDVERPRFHYSDGTGKWGLDCADALYASAALRGGHVYRIRGHRGSVHFMGLQLVAGMRAVDDLDGDALALEPDGSFELQLGGPKPERTGANWMALPDDASTLYIRQFFYDWDRELPASFEIERIDDAPRREPTRVEIGGIAAQFEALGRFVYANTDWWDQVARAKQGEHANTFPDDGGGLGAVGGASQTYQSFGIGCYCLAADEALLIEVTPPSAKYWSLHLGNRWMESLDFANHQSSLNGHQAVLDEDGVFRAVVCLEDPGVPNWLDPAGHAEGSMIYRWNQADGSPIPAARLVRRAELRSLLPATTASVRPEERRAAIERRREHVRRRYGRPLPGLAVSTR